MRFLSGLTLHNKTEVCNFIAHFCLKEKAKSVEDNTLILLACYSYFQLTQVKYFKPLM